MSHPFHYFFPGRPAAVIVPGNLPARKEFDALKLDYLADWWRKPGSFSLLESQIAGQVGALLTPTVKGESPRQLAYCADETKQRWVKSKHVWIGWEVGEEPGPELLAKPSMIAGYDVTDDAGRQWTCPIARSPNGREQLPNDLIWDLETGEPTKARKPSYDWLWELAGKVWDYWNTDEKAPDPNWIYRVALQCLQVNYRIGPLELNAFSQMGKSVLDERFGAMVTMALIDMDVQQRATELKKNEDQSTPG